MGIAIKKYAKEIPKFSNSVQLYWISLPHSKHFVWDITIGHLNVNSLRNKIKTAEELIKICLLSETKIDEIFLNQKFNISNYKTLCKDRNKHGWGVLSYISEDIPYKVINNEGVSIDIEMILFEFSVKTRKWPCLSIYKSPSQNGNYFLDIFSKVLRKLKCQYDHIMMIRYFDLIVNNKNLGVFVNKFDLESLISKPAYFQSTNPTYGDLVLTSQKGLFKSSNV